MKRFAKRLLSLCLCLCLMMTCGTCAFAAKAPCDCGKTPFVLVQGFNCVPLCDPETGNPCFPPVDPATLTKAVLRLSFDLTLGIWEYQFTHSWDTISARLIPTLKIVFGALACDDKGVPQKEMSFLSCPGSMEAYPEGRELLMGFGTMIGEDIGWDHTYVFTYDWRYDAKTLATQLHEFIEMVKSETGHDQVDLACHSMGAAVTLAYLDSYAKDENYASIHNMVFTSPAWQGTSMMGDMLCGLSVVNMAGLAKMLDRVMGQTLWSRPLANALVKATDWILQKIGLPDMGTLSEVILPVAFDNYLTDQFGNTPGIWLLSPYSSFDTAYKRNFSDGITPELKEKLEYYHRVQGNATALIDGARAAGVGFAIISGYDYALAPVTSETHIQQADLIIDTRYTGGFPTLAPLDETLGDGYVQAKNDGHNHLSADGIVDASTCLYPENTWFVRHLAHSAYTYGEDSKLVVWLLQGGCRGTVWDNPTYPQFLDFNEKADTLLPN